MSSKFNLLEASDPVVWDRFVDESENGTIYSQIAYLEFVDVRYRCFWVRRSEEIRAGLVVIESADPLRLVSNDFVIYSGILFGPATNKQNRAQIHSERFEVAEFVANELVNRYDSIHLALHPSVIDIRAFQWVNYGSKPNYQASVLYTSYVDISEFTDAYALDSAAMAGLSSSRRQEIRYARKNSVITAPSMDTERFVDFYDQTMKRQSINVETIVLEQMQTLISGLLKKERAKMFVATTADGEAGSMAVFANDKKRSYYLFGANSPDKRDSHTGSALLWDCFHFLSHDGQREVDLEGINSPKRGWFKLSFGGDIRPYYHLTLEKTLSTKGL
jgi:hypothetical protein